MWLQNYKKWTATKTPMAADGYSKKASANLKFYIYCPKSSIGNLRVTILISLLGFETSGFLWKFKFSTYRALCEFLWFFWFFLSNLVDTSKNVQTHVYTKYVSGFKIVWKYLPQKCNDKIYIFRWLSSKEMCDLTFEK